MKRLVLAALAASLVAACAPVQYTKADVDGLIVCNTDAMDQVERQARRSYATVHWVNCPRATLRVVS